MKQKSKAYILAVCTLLLAVFLAGCMNSGNRTDENQNTAEATETPYVGTQPAPVTSPAPTGSENQSGGQSGGGSGTDGGQGGQQAQPYDWKQNASAVEGRIDQFSEIASSRVVVNGTTALVGVEFDPQYKGEMTERVRQMIAGVVMSYDAQIQTVAATSNPEDVKKIGELGDKMSEGSAQEELKTEMDKILRNTTTLS